MVNTSSFFYFTVTELTTDPVATVPWPPAVSETTPALVTPPASEPATPELCDVTSPKFGTAPVAGALVGTASRVICYWLNENDSPEVAFCVAAMVPGA